MAVSTQPLISVIVPVYNVERYLDQCVESLIGQTYERLEIILVDDGSTDSSGEQCNAWANRDNRIRAVRQCNAGLAAARNTGLYRYRMSENSQSHGITDKFAQSTGAMLDLVRTKYPHVEAYAAYGHLESIVGTCNRIMLAHQRKQWAQFERYARTELRELLPMVERKGIIGKSQLLQWKLLATSPTLYGMMYALYKRRHPEIASH